MFTKVNNWLHEWDRKDYTAFESVVLWVRRRFVTHEVA